MNAGKLHIYNTLTRKKELFEPLNPPFVGLYVCGPTVYGEAHLGHARPAITFDILYRYLSFQGYKLRYVRNITDVGHLENDADEGEDKIAKKARLEKIEPMEVAHIYTENFQDNMRKLNVKTPSIEPRASGHIIEQLEIIDKIVESGFAYEKDGSVYFDVLKYNKSNNYGKLSGRIIEDLLSTTRELDGQDEKNSSLDFALWKKAKPEHIMRWKSKWSEGFPGWHLECTAMSTKYLGEEFDIHGGGMDLLFPHHECEIAQSRASLGKDPAKYWMHNNMITINGQKMGKSLGNFITLNELFTGTHKILNKSYSPMTVRFFILQAHYRSTLDFSNEALEASEKGLKRLLTGYDVLMKLKAVEQIPENLLDKKYSLIGEMKSKFYEALNDDLNTPVLISYLFDGLSVIYNIKEEKLVITTEDLKEFQKLYSDFIFEILGLRNENNSSNDSTVQKLMDLIIKIRKTAKEEKNYSVSDQIRNELGKIGIILKDNKVGTEWSKE